MPIPKQIQYTLSGSVFEAPNVSPKAWLFRGSKHPLTRYLDDEFSFLLGKQSSPMNDSWRYPIPKVMLGYLVGFTFRGAVTKTRGICSLIGGEEVPCYNPGL